ncbi:MAG: CAP domain-containing protein [Halodesulfurarchaeum sp.]
MDSGRLQAPATERLLFQYVNQVREEAGRPILDRRSSLDRLATAVANGTIEEKRVRAQNSSGGATDGLRNWTQVTCTRTSILQSTLHVGESSMIGNRSVSFDDPREFTRGVVYAWRSEPSRRRILLSENWSIGGAAVVRESGDEIRVVLVVCSASKGDDLG